MDANAVVLKPPLPCERHLRWHEMEVCGFIHFTVNTFTDQEWGYGDESPAVFNPTALDARQWVRVARQAGMKGLILTCKHHDGFCLWPSRCTEHSVKNSPWKNGKGDVVREVSDACAEGGLKFGVYLSPWDRHHPEYGRPEYVRYYRNQLRELLSQYGPVFEVWFDGANGGDGFYGGAREMRRIEAATYYEWPEIQALVRELQPEAIIFGDAGPDIRWVGNERGLAGDPCWATYTPHGVNGRPPAAGATAWQEGENGHADGAYWMPAECDVSIRPGWFHHPAEDEKVKTLAELLDIYYRSVGRGAGLLLNLPPDRRGLIHEADVSRLAEFRGRLDAVFANDLAVAACIRAAGASGETPPAHAVDGRADTYWMPKGPGGYLELSWPRPVRFDHVLLQEHIELGQRVRAWTVEAESDDRWVTVGGGKSIGHKYILCCGPVASRRVRLSITESAAAPALQRIGVFGSK